MGFGDDTDDYGALLHGFSRVFDLEDSTLGRAGAVSRICDCRMANSQGHTVIVVIISKHGDGVLWLWRGDVAVQEDNVV